MNTGVSGNPADMSTDGKTDDAKGRLKEAGGALTGDEDLKREGKKDQAVGKVKDGVDKVADGIKKAVS
jgi:uncharacterized protein YjbJ (UPF0337 family)